MIFRGECSESKKSVLKPTPIHLSDIKKNPSLEKISKCIWLTSSVEIAMVYAINPNRTGFGFYPNKEIKYLKTQKLKKGLLYYIDPLPLRLDDNLIVSSSIPEYKEYIATKEVVPQECRVVTPEEVKKRLERTGYSLKGVDRLHS